MTDLKAVSDARLREMLEELRIEAETLQTMIECRRSRREQLCRWYGHYRCPSVVCTAGPLDDVCWRALEILRAN